MLDVRSDPKFFPMTKTQRFTLAATSLGLFMIYLDALIVNVALPVIQSDFNVVERMPQGRR